MGIDKEELMDKLRDLEDTADDLLNKVDTVIADIQYISTTLFEIRRKGIE